jgi:hypothetical protein
MTTHRTPRTLSAALLTAALLVAPGCNVVGPVFYAVHGPDKVQPLYTLDPTRSTLILVDDPASTVGERSLRAEMADTATNILLQKEITTNMIDPRPALVLATKQTDGKPMSITEIGRAVEADVVVYVLLTEFTTSADGNALMPACSMRVKILDARTGQRLFPPDDPKGVPVALRPEYRAGDLEGSSAAEADAERELAQKAGLAIAQLFYKHEITESARR